jgi:hypothetical protein
VENTSGRHETPCLFRSHNVRTGARKREYARARTSRFKNVLKETRHRKSLKQSAVFTYTIN